MFDGKPLRTEFLTHGIQFSLFYVTLGTMVAQERKILQVNSLHLLISLKSNASILLFFFALSPPSANTHPFLPHPWQGK